VLRQLIEQILLGEPMISIDYVEIVDWGILQPIEVLEKPVLIAVAVKFGSTRLIDNYIWE
jgi:pantoate--beta-alanine ligase